MNKIVAIIVTYNRKKLLKECLEALLQLENESCDILIIDNASTDHTQEYIIEYLSQKNEKSTCIYEKVISDEFEFAFCNGKVQYYRTKENLGGAGGFHVGMELAVQKGYSYIWIMDDDTIVQRDTLHELMKADKQLDGNYGFLSSIAYWTDGSLCNMNRQRVSINGKLESLEGDITEIIMATFVSFFIKADTVRKVGLPISEFFIWADDLEYSRRISKEMPCYAVSKSKVLHKMGSNAKVGIEQESKDRLWRYQYLYRNEVYVFRREGIKGYAYMFLRVMLHCAKVLLKSNNGRMYKLKVLLSSFMNGFSFQPPIKYVKEEKK